MKKSEEIRNLLIANTKELMKSNRDVTIREIAKASFVNIAAVNYYFGDKENLISIVINEAVSELKGKLYQAIVGIDRNEPIETAFASMIDVIYLFALENTGIISYLFFNTGQKITSNLILNEFLLDNEFSDFIIDKLKESSTNQDHETLYAKYTLLFSSFAIPLFIEIMQSLNPEAKKEYTLSLNNERFRNIYINELIKIIK